MSYNKQIILPKDTPVGKDCEFQEHESNNLEAWLEEWKNKTGQKITPQCCCCTNAPATKAGRLVKTPELQTYIVPLCEECFIDLKNNKQIKLKSDSILVQWP